MIKGNDVVALLEQIKSLRGVPRSIRCDNGPEFVSKILDKWAYESKVELDFSRPGKPTDNAFWNHLMADYLTNVCPQIGFCPWIPGT